MVPVPIRRIQPDIVVLEFTTLPKGYKLEAQLLRLLRQGDRKFIFDLSGVKLITSEGAACIAFCFPTVQSVGGQMRVAGASGWVRKEFAVTRLDTIIPFDPSVAAAQQALKA